MALGIAVTASILLVVIITNSAGIFYQQSSQIQEGLNINDALAAIRNNVKLASSVAASYTSGSTTYTTSASQLVLKVSSIDSSGNIIANAYDFMVIYTDQKILHYKVFPNSSSFRKSADRIFSNSVDSLSFQYLNSAIPPVEVSPTQAVKIRTTLILKQKNGINTETNTAVSEVNLRND
ncbi:MAG: hypothetical protein M1142_05185 [Patescibacteria group bacterium]|nr:hypothetical protein [Patescibacteria group bacterium]